MPPKVAATTKSPALRTLQTRLKVLQTSFNNIHTYVADFKDDSVAFTPTELSVRLESLDATWEEINEVINDILAHEDFVLEPKAMMDERIVYENQYFEDKSFLIDKLKLYQEPVHLDQSSRNESVMQVSVPRVRLPQISLPIFNGDLDEWIPFRDLFTSLIHWQSDLPDVEKLHYLRGQLRGEALSVIDDLPISKTNYQIAWDLLVKHYSDTKLLKRKQVQGLFKLPFLRKESASELHSLIENFERIIKIIDQLVQPADYRDLLLVYKL